MACRGSAVRVRLAPLFFLIHNSRFYRIYGRAWIILFCLIYQYITIMIAVMRSISTLWLYAGKMVSTFTPYKLNMHLFDMPIFILWRSSFLLITWKTMIVFYMFVWWVHLGALISIKTLRHNGSELITSFHEDRLLLSLKWINLFFS